MSFQVFLIVAPSGAGKSSLIKALLGQRTDICLSVSYTTRIARAGEINGEHYHFISKDEFNALQTKNDFVESAFVHGNYYGTSQTWLNKQLQTSHVLLEIDWQGAQQIKNLMPKCIQIFILPPSFKVLSERLIARETDAPEVIKQRLINAKIELLYAQHTNYWIINDEFAKAVKQLNSVIDSCLLTKASQIQNYNIDTLIHQIDTLNISSYE